MLRRVILCFVMTLALACFGCSTEQASPYQPPPLLDGGYTGADGSSGGHADGGGSSSGSGDASLPDGSGGSPDASVGADGGPIVPPSTCPETFTLADSSYTTVNLETDYNDWTTAIPMTKNGSGAWTGDHARALREGRRVQVRRRRQLDVGPGQPTIDLPSNAGMNTNNILQAVTCGLSAPARCSSSAAASRRPPRATPSRSSSSPAAPTSTRRRPSSP